MEKVFVVKSYGLIAAVVTPMNNKYEVLYDEFEKYIRWVVSQGVSGIAVGVDTGEGPSLYREEKLNLVKTAKKVAGSDVVVVAGLQAINTYEAVKLAKDLEKAGADALLVFPHSAFIGEPNEDVIFEYHRAINDNVKVPLIIFNLQPALGGVEYKPSIIKKLSELSNVKAIKEASFDAKKFLDIVRAIEKLPRKIQILTGNDNFIYESLVMGAEGGLLGFGTIAVKEQVEMFNLIAKEKYKEARELWYSLLPLMEVIFSPPVRNYRARLKEALCMMGVIETTYVRPPLLPISPEEREKIRNVLRELKML
ncbi:MAG: dihydrodipicolinate synthase family protein [Desulfurococcaceae archaeon]